MEIGIDKIIVIGLTVAALVFLFFINRKGGRPKQKPPNPA